MPTREPTGYAPPKLRFKQKAYPQSPNESLPKLFFVACFVAPRGVGKTWAACELLKSYEKDKPIDPETGERSAIRIIVCSPSYDANPCFKALRSIDDDDVYRSYSDSVITQILQSVEDENKATEKYQKDLALYRKWERSQSLKGFTDQELMWLEMNDYQPPMDKPRYPSGVCNFLVLDDLIGSSAFKSGKNPLVNMLLRNRHHRISILIMSQHIKSINRSIRGNVSLWFLGKFSSRSILPDVYEEAASALLTEEEFEQLYDEATSDEHGALIIDFSKPKAQRFSASFKHYLTP